MRPVRLCCHLGLQDPGQLLLQAAVAPWPISATCMVASYASSASSLCLHAEAELPAPPRSGGGRKIHEHTYMIGCRGMASIKHPGCGWCWNLLEYYLLSIKLFYVSFSSSYTFSTSSPPSPARSSSGPDGSKPHVTRVTTHHDVLGPTGPARI